MARNDEPWIINCESSFDDGVITDSEVVCMSGVVSREVVRWGAARVGRPKVVCIGEERAEVRADTEGVLVRVDLIEPVSEEVLASTSLAVFSETIERFLGGTGFKIEIPRVPKTLFAVLRRSRLLVIPFDDRS